MLIPPNAPEWKQQHATLKRLQTLGISLDLPPVNGMKLKFGLRMAYHADIHGYGVHLHHSAQANLKKRHDVAVQPVPVRGELAGPVWAPAGMEGKSSC